MADITPFKALRHKDLQELINLNKPSNLNNYKSNIFNLPIAKSLIEDNLASIYIYFQSYINSTGKKCLTKGWIANLQIANWEENIIFKHEQVNTESVNNHLKKFQTTQYNDTPIHVLFNIPFFDLEVLMNESIQNPVFTFVDKENVTHIISVIQDNVIIKKFQQVVKNEKVVIADGHHRYHAALRNFNLFSDNKFIPAYFTNIFNNDLTILSFYKLYQFVEKIDEKILINALSKHFFIKELNYALPNDNQNHFCLILSDKILSLEFMQAGDFSNELIEEEIKKSYLDINFTNIYVDNINFCKERIKNGFANFGFIMKSYEVETIVKMSLEGKILPEKSTCFYPKIPKGLIIQNMSINQINGNEKCFNANK